MEKHSKEEIWKVLAGSIYSVVVRLSNTLTFSVPAGHTRLPVFHTLSCTDTNLSDWKEHSSTDPQHACKNGIYPLFFRLNLKIWAEKHVKHVQNMVKLTWPKDTNFCTNLELYSVGAFVVVESDAGWLLEWFRDGFETSHLTRVEERRGVVFSNWKWDGIYSKKIMRLTASKGNGEWISFS